VIHSLFRYENPLAITIGSGIIVNARQLQMIVLLGSSFINIDSMRVPTRSIKLATRKSLPTYLLALYHTLSFESVFLILNPYRGFSGTFSSIRGIEKPISSRPTIMEEIKTTISIPIYITSNSLYLVFNIIVIKFLMNLQNL